MTRLKRKERRTCFRQSRCDRSAILAGARCGGRPAPGAAEERCTGETKKAAQLLFGKQAPARRACPCRGWGQDYPAVSGTCRQHCWTGATVFKNAIAQRSSPGLAVVVRPAPGTAETRCHGGGETKKAAQRFSASRLTVLPGQSWSRRACPCRGWGQHYPGG